MNRVCQLQYAIIITSDARQGLYETLSLLFQETLAINVSYNTKCRYTQNYITITNFTFSHIGRRMVIIQLVVIIYVQSFVMVDWNVLTPGSVVGPVSVYNGEQYYITISVKKDAKTGDWFLYREDLGEAKLIGYWPKSLFTTLADRADAVSWGGMVSYDTDDAGPPLGSGHHASELERKAAYFKNIEIFYSDGKSYDLIDGAQDRFADKEECYTISKLVDSSKYGRHDGHLFYFGGPGGCDG
ncbi:hypothetical protein ACMD2_17816 [Ananas comosus]|uniref:Neprosin PEP catalytic domain-containing protein n=1 Tax=Ananas comosus TaxID=4615 RepID=A0A199UZ42_ANACO|nr:hypothetical protein ACMD2_17816 [Ananas comosus]